MSHTNQTPNYHLPQFIGTDKPAWLVDFNQSMSDIDTQMKANETASATAEANAQSALSGVTALNSQVGGLQTDVTAIQTQMPLDEAQIATNAQNISTQASAIVNANNRIDTANANIATLGAKVGDLTDLDTTDKTSVVNAINEVNEELNGGYFNNFFTATKGTFDWQQEHKIGEKLIAYAFRFTANQVINSGSEFATVATNAVCNTNGCSNDPSTIRVDVIGPNVRNIGSPIASGTSMIVSGIIMI